MDEKHIKQIEAHLKRTFGNPHFQVKARKQKDSAEVELKSEFIGVIYEDEDEPGSFLFEMAILAEDLE
ncbi:MAG: DUF3126 family protein [Caulobacter sp.]|nr:DUF3126 family protein [Caulobacter sp.]